MRLEAEVPTLRAFALGDLEEHISARVVVGTQRRPLDQRGYAAIAQGGAVFGPLLTAVIDARTGVAAPIQVRLGDGAAWIWRVGAEVVPTATRVLARWHLAHARRRALRAVLAEQSTRAPWSARLEERLEVGDVPGAVAVVAAIAAGTPHPALTAVTASGLTLAPGSPNDAARRAAGERIGSGGSEKGGDVVVNRRRNGRRGLRWWRVRREGVVAVRVALLNDTWDQLFPPALAAQHVPAL